MPVSISPHGTFLDFLFLAQDKPKARAGAPNPSFKPTVAIAGGNPWVTITAPSQEQRRKKKIIIDSSSFAACYPNLLRFAIPLILKLRAADFEVFLCLEEGVNKALYQVDGAEELADKLEKLANFEEDHELARKFQIARDETLFLKEELRREVYELLDKRIHEQLVQRTEEREGASSVFNYYIHSTDISIGIWEMPAAPFNFEHLRLSFQYFPAQAEAWLATHHGLITNNFELAACLKVAPSRYSESIYKYRRPLTSAQELAALMKAAPMLASQIYSEYKSVIKNDSDLALCIKSAPSIAPEIIRESNATKDARGRNFIAIIPYLSEDMLREQGDSLKNAPPAMLKALLKIAPQVAERFFLHDSLGNEPGDEVAFSITVMAEIPVAEKRIFIRQDGGIAVKTKNELQEFIESIQDSREVQPIILINWDTFEPGDKIRLNSLIDKKRSILGMKIPTHAQVVGICSKEYSKDYSFLSRHDSILRLAIEEEKFSSTSSDILKSVFGGEDISAAAPQEIIPTELDFQGYPDWKSVLFGRVLVKGTKAVWEKSELVKRLLEPGVRAFKFKAHNISAESKKELTYMIRQARAYGYFTYHGFKIPLPADFSFSFAEKEFDFSTLLREKNPIFNIVSKATVPQAGYHAASSGGSSNLGTIITSINFDRLISDPEILLSKEYFERAGLIEGASQRHVDAWIAEFEEFQKSAARYKPGEENQREIILFERDRLQGFKENGLPLFITTDLSKSQWYCLIKLAIKHDVKLNLLLASNVTLPEEVKEFCRDIIKEAQTREVVYAPTVYITNCADASYRQTLKGKFESEPLVIDVEDYNYPDLIRRMAAEFEVSGDEVSFTFKEIESAVHAEIMSTKRTVIFKGRFDPALLEALHPLLAEVRKNLILIVEDPQLQPTAKSLQFIKGRCQQLRFPEIVARKPLTIEEEISDKYKELSAEASAEFIAGRKKLLRRSLIGSSMVLLTGEAGVGKSTLMKKMADEPGVKVYHGLDAFEKFASSDARTPMLFLDESNLHDKHLTMFSPLKRSGSREILYNGKLHKLGPNHQVVFACNHLNYGGRFEQKLFEDGVIDEIKLARFPNCYLYTEVLKKGIYDKISDTLRKEIPEDEFKRACESYLDEYNSRLDTAPNIDEITPRDLQERVLYHLIRKLNPELIAHQEIANDSFVTTSATIENERCLKAFLRIREMQKCGAFPTAGKNGIFLQGDPGIGKSEMARAVLENMGYQAGYLTELFEELSVVATLAAKKCYRITTDLPPEYITKALVAAFNRGAIVFIDEINSYPGLESTLNSLLTGINPLTGEPAANPGFGLIATGNPISHEGRTELSPALRSRMEVLTFRPLAAYSREDLETIAGGLLANLEPAKERSKTINPEISKVLIANLMTNFLKDPDWCQYLNIRTFKTFMASPEVRQELFDYARDMGVARHSRSGAEVATTQIFR